MSDWSAQIGHLSPACLHFLHSLMFVLSCWKLVWSPLLLVPGQKDGLLGYPSWYHLLLEIGSAVPSVSAMWLDCILH